MTIFNMTIKNIKGNFKNYWAYFLSSSFSVFVVYLFMAILYSKNIQENLGGVKKFIVLFNVASVMIVIFSAFFIWYSNSFFIKSRKKEFATYMLLGMSQKQVSRLNFLENIFIMLLSLVTGIILGLVFTKFFIMLLFFMIKVSAVVSFGWNLKALKICIIIFLVIFTMITLHGIVIVRKSKLIDLFNASKKVEKGLKVSVVTVLLGIVAIISTLFGYYTAIEKVPSDFTKIPVVVGLVVLGTILFFTSTTALIIYLNKKNEKKLFRGTKLISVSQLYYRYRGNAGTLSIMAITTTIALCALVTCVGSYARTEENSRYMRPLSVEYFNKDNADNIFNNVLKKHTEISIKHMDNISIINAEAIDVNLGVKCDFYVINESEFNRLNKHENINRSAKLKTNADCYFIQVQNFVPNVTAINKKTIINVAGKSYNVKISATDIRPFIAMDHFKQTLIVKDSVYNDMLKRVNKANLISMTGFNLKDDFIAKDFITDLEKNIPKDAGVLTFYDHYHDGLRLLGMMAFIGLFIGLLFIMATGSIIFFKMNMEAREDKNKFITLRKIGVSKKEIKMAVAKELLLLFGAPLIFAVMNTYPATCALEKMLALKLMKPYIVIVAVYAIVYCLYYFITLNSYTKTISE